MGVHRANTKNDPCASSKQPYAELLGHLSDKILDHDDLTTTGRKSGPTAAYTQLYE